MGFWKKLWSGTGTTSASKPGTPAAGRSGKPLPVSGGHVEKDTPLRCPKCGDLKRETTPRYAVFVCNKCRALVSIHDYNVQI
jgi:hypothetical protein